MTRFRQFGGAAMLLLALLICLPAAAQAGSGRVRIWHGTPIRNLDSPPAFATAAGPPTTWVPGDGFSPARSGAAIIRLSDERTFTHWANPAYPALIYARADGAAPRVG